MTFVATLEPRSLWGHFDRILEIPRGSTQEDRMRDYVIDLARRHGLDHNADAAGNVVVYKPATPGHEHADVTILQSHLDMVNEKNQDVAHDFTTDPIRPERQGDYLTAIGTTLGSDNGIGVAAMLAVMEAGDIVHGPLELLFTVDEETGLTGAAQLDVSMLHGRRLLNLDTEEEGAIYVGCAGGGDTTLALDLDWIPHPEAHTILALELRGLRGGHSGVDIHLQRGNALQILARVLDAAGVGVDLLIGDFRGGNMRNAIPREASATVAVPADQAERFEARALAEFRAARDALAEADPGISLELRPADPPPQVMDPASTWNTIHLLLALPHGVAAMSHDIPDLVETSTNLAVARVEDGRLTVLTNTRSSVASELRALRHRIRAAGRLAGARVELDDAYPGWKPDLASPLLATVKEVYARELGREPQTKAIHAGLETGIIGEKVPGMDMVSIGPQIEFPHSPDERVRIDSVQAFYGLLTHVLHRLAA
jgi:dipeptidase D